ncbi:class I adenylate-forming enzyme family protein [Baekduia soli]|nr:fatty acid--CoA ligase family protein [Baekduia soli]
MALMYTSGSTGRPKGVLQPNAGYQTAGQAYVDRMGITADDVWICTLPLFHAGGTHLMLAPTIAAGASLVLVPRFDVRAFWPQVHAHDATLTLLFPAQMSMLLSLPEDPTDRDNELRLSISHVVNPAFTERFGVEILTTFSQTESLGMGALTPPGSRNVAPGVVGPALPPELEIRVVDPAGDEVPRGERGEICLRHPHLMLGYHRDPENTGAALRDGWLRTGDIGTLDDRGWLTYRGRIKHMIKRMGENIAGEEVEFALMRHPDVEEAVVCSVPDPIRTEEVFAIVRGRDGRAPDIAALIAWIGDELSAWKLPRYVRVDATPFPRLPNGKLDRVTLTRDVDPADAWDREAHRVRLVDPA